MYSPQGSTQFFSTPLKLVYKDKTMSEERRELLRLKEEMILKELEGISSSSFYLKRGKKQTDSSLEENK